MGTKKIDNNTEKASIKLAYRVTKIQTIKFEFEDIDELELNDLLENNSLSINISVILKFLKSERSISLEVSTRLFKRENDQTLINHSARTIFFVQGLEDTYNDKTDSYDVPTNLIEQMYGISYTHARALLSLEISPTIYRDKYFLPIVNPKDLM